jgi:putative ABC transport system substrate-binding protein
MPVIGFLRSTSLTDATHLVTAFREGLRDRGFIEGQNVLVEYRSGEDDPTRLATLATQFAHMPVDVIVGNIVAAVAAKGATSTVPIVFATGSDPVKDGLVSNLNKPGGNITGVTFFAGLLGEKLLEMLRQIVPTATTIGVLVGPESSDTIVERRDVEMAAQAAHQKLIISGVGNVSDIEAAFATFADGAVGALFTGSGAFLHSQRERIAALAASHRLPAIYGIREFAEAGGLISYGGSIIDAYRQVGIYAGRILRGEKAANLPIMRSTKLEFIINLKAAKALGLTIPPSLLARADEVIV